MKGKRFKVVCPSCGHRFSHPGADCIEDLLGYYLACPRCDEELVGDPEKRKVISIDSWMKLPEADPYAVVPVGLLLED